MDDTVKQKLEAFFSGFKHLTYKKGEIVFRPSESITQIAFLKKGLVRMYALSEGGEEITLHVFRPDSFFPTMLSLGKMESKYYFEVTDLAEAYIAPAEKVIAFLKSEPEVLLNLTSRFAQGLTGMMLRVENLAFQDSYPKIVSLLLYLSKRFGKQNGDETIIELEMSHTDIASWAGVTRETVSRQMEKLQKKGIIANKKRLLVIKDLNMLQQEISVQFEH